MTELTAAKSWTISAAITPEQGLRFYAGNDLAVDLATLSPVEQLLGAICSCFGQSCAAIMAYHGLAPSRLHVTCEGHKPEGPIFGKGLDRLNLEVRFFDPMDAAKQSRILSDTKRVCTVTNSLSSEIQIVVTAGRDEG